MNIFLIVISCIFILTLAFILGYIVSGVIRKNKDYSGTMKVLRDEDKVLYSLELHDDPIMLEHKSEVIFRVDTSDQSSNRN